MESRSPAAGEPDSGESQNSFVWDESSQLYFHGGSGFYHDPTAGWYYSTRDGLYYKFEDGNYVPLPSHQGDDLENPNQDDQFAHENECIDAVPVPQEPIAVSGNAECCSGSDAPEIPPPPSEWLEETLINMYLSGYSNLQANTADDMEVFPQTDVEPGGDGKYHRHEINEGELILEGHDAAIKPRESVSDEGTSWEEENWRAQYGQVIQSAEVSIPDSSLISLWDWTMTTEPKKNGKGEVSRLVGRLVRRYAKLHPSMASGGGLLKTAPICEVHLDLVRVITGKVYKLQTPSKKYLSSLSTYDSSNPTKDWGFPELSVDRQVLPLSKSSVNNESKTAGRVTVSEDSSSLPDTTYGKLESYAYRDRAADRRALHGGFGVGPGQKNSLLGDSDPSSSVSTEEAAAEALNMSFGVGSYARKLLENMGWKEGEGLGKTTKGMAEPIQAQSNMGNAGLGWPQGRLKHRQIDL